MTSPTPPRPFGRALCAMITPFTPTGALDLDGAGRLADHPVTRGCDGLVLSGTTGEFPTTTDAEKSALIAAVREAVGSRASIVAGVGAADAARTAALAREAEKAGADGLPVVAPYCSRPPQDAVEAHFRVIADATDLPRRPLRHPGPDRHPHRTRHRAPARRTPRDRGGQGLLVRLPGRPEDPRPHRPSRWAALVERGERVVGLRGGGGVEELRKLAAPFVAPGPSGVAIRTRLKQLTCADEEELGRVGAHLGALASGDLKARCRDGLAHGAGAWATRKRELTPLSSARWAGAPPTAHRSSRGPCLALVASVWKTRWRSPWDQCHRLVAFTAAGQPTRF